MSVTRGSTVFFFSFLAAIFVELEKGRREDADGEVFERVEEVREERKDWRRGETICRMELCVDAIVRCGLEAQLGNEVSWKSDVEA
jgi:predicted ATP-binding protein involved in virulence